MEKLTKVLISSLLGLMMFLSSVPVNAENSLSFSDKCQTYGYYGVDDWFHVQLQNMTGTLSNSCVADDWSVTGDEDVFGEIIKSTQEVKIKRENGGAINIRAINGEEMTGDNYIMLAEANGSIEDLDFSDRCQTYGFYGLDDWFYMQLQDMNGNSSDNCIADNWDVIGENNVFGEIIENSQEVKIKRENGGAINIIAVNGSETTNDNYIALIKANNSINELPPTARYEDKVIVNMKSFNNPFPDTDIDAIAGLAASELYRRSIIGGYPDGEFKGERDVNRAEAAKFLLLARFETVGDVSNNGKFSDVLDGEWYVKFIVTAANKGIIKGYSDGSFKPGSAVNTAEFLKMLAITFDIDENMSYSYADVESNEWYAKYAGIAGEYELFPSKSTYLNPGSDLTREDVSIAIYQYLLNR